MSDKSESYPQLLGAFISIHVEWGPNLSWYHGRRLAAVDQCIHTENEMFKRKKTYKCASPFLTLPCFFLILLQAFSMPS